MLTSQLLQLLGAAGVIPGTPQLPAYQATTMTSVTATGAAPTGALGTNNFLQLLLQGLGAAPVAPLGANLFAGGLMGMGQSITSMTQVVTQQQSLEASALGLSALEQKPAMLTSAPSSTFAAGLPTDKREVGQALNVGGKQDIERINRAVEELGSARVLPATAQPGDRTQTGKLVLSAEDVERIRNAPDAASAKAELALIIGRQTGLELDAPDMKDQKAIKNRKYRDAMNVLLGTEAKNGKEKNSGSAMVFDALLESTVSAIKTSQPATSLFSSTALRSTGAAGVSMSETTVITRPFGPMTMDLGDYIKPMETVAELSSPLIFDLTGKGLKIRTARHVKLDLDGDGREEVITDLEQGMGLLVFDSKVEGVGAGRDMFGDGTDLRGYGITGPRDDGAFNNGFEALRALCEQMGRVREDKQFLDAGDLAFLEQQCGLRMRTDGVLGTADKRFAELGIGRVNLGREDGIQAIESADEDAFGNRFMRQAGATFVIRGQTREYVDIWFNVQARTGARPESIKVPTGVLAQNTTLPARRMTTLRG